jgi:hypothetical protein
MICHCISLLYKQINVSKTMFRTLMVANARQLGILIPTIDYKPGVYTCLLKINDKIIAVKKFTVIH